MEDVKLETDVEFSKKSQLQRIRAYVVAGEILYGVLDLEGDEIAFLGVTDRRLIVRNRAFAHKQEAMVSVPYSRVTSFAVAESEDPPLSTGTLYVTTLGGTNYVLRFPSWEKSHKAYTILAAQILQQEAAG